MRTCALAIASAALFILPTSAFSVEFDVGPGGVGVNPGYHRYHRYEGRSGYATDCRSLRQACLKKEQLGEVGAGNCERYRRLCR